MSTSLFVTVPAAQPYHHGNLRHALVQAGLELGRAGGPTAIVLREAARRVGVSPNAAYRHFSDLPDLIEAVALEALAMLARSMEAELALRNPTGDDRLDAKAYLNAVGRGYVHFALNEPGLFATAFSSPKTNHGGADQPDHGGEGDSGLTAHELLEAGLDRMLEAGVLAAEDRESAATTAWASVHGLSLLLLGPMSGLPPQQREALIDASLDLVGRGLIIRE
jgi:AcrR family transcriptional regulator